MPLRAIAGDSKSVIAPLLDEAAWDMLARSIRGGTATLTLPCCGTQARPRRSKTGLQHFFHYRPRGQPKADCASESESLAHLEAKAEIMRCLAARDIPVGVEVAGNGWRADVLSQIRGQQIAWEVQISPQDATTTRERTERYAADQVKVVWLMKRRPRELNDRQLAFRLLTQDGRRTVALEDPDYREPDAIVDLPDFIDALIDQRLAYSPGRPVAGQLDVAVIPHTCWVCHRAYALLYAWQHAACRCGRDLEGLSGVDDASLAVLLKRHCNDLLPFTQNGNLPLAHLQERYSKTVGHRYVANCCPHPGCNAFCGEFFLHDEMAAHLAGGDDPELTVPVPLADLRLTDDPHWCLTPKPTHRDPAAA